MRKKKIYIAIVIIIVIIIGVTIKFYTFEAKRGSVRNEHWVAYFAPSYTSIGYGDRDAMVVKFDNYGNYEIIKENAYAFSSLLSYKDDIIYQNSNGVASLNTQKSLDNVAEGKSTVGYNMSGVLKSKDFFYFLLNGTFKDNAYSSNIIIGNTESQKIHEIEGFINSYGNDDENIYLITSDLTNVNLKKIKKITIDEKNNISIKEEIFITDEVLSSNNIMTIADGFIYAFCVKERIGVSILKISLDTLKLNSVIDLIEFKENDNIDKYYPVSTNSIFEKDGKIYYPTLNGDVYSFNPINGEFKIEFTIENYRFNKDQNLVSSYNPNDDTISFLFFDYEKEQYYLGVYSIEGILKESRYINNIKIPEKMYPHSFLKPY